MFPGDFGPRGAAPLEVLLARVGPAAHEPGLLRREMHMKVDYLQSVVHIIFAYFYSPSSLR